MPYKKIRLSLVVPFCCSEKTDLIVRLSNVTFRNKASVVDPVLTNHWFYNFCKEIKIRERYLCTPKPLEVFIQEPCEFEEGRLYVFERALQNLDVFPKDATGKELLECSLSMIDGLLEFHSDGRIHGDIKRSNVLWYVEQEKIVCKWIDLGFSQKFNDVEEKKDPRLCHWYGSIVCTPPELLGKELTSPQDLFAVEAWALGFLLYSLVFEYPSWSNMLLWAYEKGKVNFNELHELVVKEIQVSLRFMLLKTEGGPPSLLKEVRRICLELLNIDPTARCTLLQAREYLEKCSQPANDCSEVAAASSLIKRSVSV